jgi:hypothetical protein
MSGHDDAAAEPEVYFALSASHRFVGPSSEGFLAVLHALRHFLNLIGS